MAAVTDAGGGHGKSYVLGIDVGTTTIKVAVIDRDTRKVVRTNSRETQAGTLTELGSKAHEQDPQKILTALQICVSGLQQELSSVRVVAVTGQMHGVVLWKHGESWRQRKSNSYGRFDLENYSPLFTWQDGRCTSEYLSTLPPPCSHLRLASGHGCATLFWLQHHRPDLLQKYDCAGTIQDLVVAMLCGLERPVMSVHNAASWGYYNTEEKQWNREILESAGFPVHLLPCVFPAGTMAGTTQSDWYGIAEGTPVTVAMGDLQCSILSGMQGSQDAVLNISTSAQLAYQMPHDFVPVESSDRASAVEFFPYFDGRYLAVAASLNGGNIMAAFIKMLQQWTHELGLGVPENEIWEKVLALGQEVKDSDLCVTPTIFGERHLPNQRGTVSNITPFNTSLGATCHAICSGVVNNLHSMMPQQFLLAAGVQRIMGSGTALLKNTLLQKEIKNHYSVPLVLCEDGTADAAVGAAMATFHT